MKPHLAAESWYMPDTVLHPLNGQCIVDIGSLAKWLESNVPWLSPDDAETLADSLRTAAALARQHEETEDTHED